MSSAIPPGAPAPLEPTAAGRGWGKKILVGCGVVALVVAACLLAVILYLRRHPERATDFVMNQVETHYAADVTPAEKDDLRAAYARFRTALQEHRVPPEVLEGFRSRVMVSGSSNEFTREQVRDLTSLFRQAVAARSQSGSAPTPVLSPRPSP